MADLDRRTLIAGAAAVGVVAAVPAPLHGRTWNRKFAALRGEKLTCPNGHEIATILADIGWNDTNYGPKIGAWTGNAYVPASYGIAIEKCKCTACGEMWFDGQLVWGRSPCHFNGEPTPRWRPEA
jgi:hypothetical protein